jgi:quercetin dioxygenase-like cupin family protein
MLFNPHIKLLMFSIVFIFFVSCTDQSQSDEGKTADTTSISNTKNNTSPLFDTSRSVTTISPNLYKPLADTLNIRMLQGTYQPGDSSIMHGHPDFALYVLEGSTVELTAEDGNKQSVEFKKDMAIVLPAATHSAKNIGKTTLKLIVVEVNRPRD